MKKVMMSVVIEWSKASRSITSLAFVSAELFAPRVDDMSSQETIRRVFSR